ncbi:MAG TPA: hypothetical protein VGP76_28960 [Planctomycetaceae bacterium]|nr:hypothetical protein [Planctomycetaceae bacterium]
MKTCLSCSAAVLGLLILSSQASASLITPGGGTVPVTAEGPLSSPFFIAAMTGPQTITLTVGSQTATVTGQEWVVESANPPVGDTVNSGTTLSFIYQVRGASEILSSITAGGFAGFLTDVGQSPFLAGLPGGLVGTTGFSGASESLGGNINATFPSATGLPAGTASFFFMVNTNAVGITPNSFTSNDNVAITFHGFGPSNTPNIFTPEPTSAMLCLSCVFSFAGAAGWRRWRKQPKP